jgi:3D (Asp-Asp-Asp) domain-containing protein
MLYLQVGAAVFTLSAYCLAGGSGLGVTKGGTVPVEGFTIAADPAVVPLGSSVHIEGLGTRWVHDTGGAIRGRRLDVFMERCSEAKRFGKQRLVVRIVTVGGRNPAR